MGKIIFAELDSGFRDEYIHIDEYPDEVKAHEMNFIEFGEEATNLIQARSVPSLLYNQLKFDDEQFLQDFEVNPLMPPPVPKLHPSKICDVILELSTTRDKRSKGLLLDSSIEEIPY